MLVCFFTQRGEYTEGPVWEWEKGVDGGDATLLTHKGYEMENGSNWIDSPSESEEEQVIKLNNPEFSTRS